MGAAPINKQIIRTRLGVKHCLLRSPEDFHSTNLIFCYSGLIMFCIIVRVIVQIDFKQTIIN